MHFLAGFHSGVVGPTALAFASSFALTVLLVALTIRVCKKLSWVSQPRTDRWHKGTPALFGGVPLFAAFAVLSLAFLPWSNHLLWKLVGVASLMFVLGLIDDIHRLAPAPKFAAQLVAAAILIASGVVYPLRGNIAIDIVVSVLWLVGITNAFNLLDNMDGLSAGIALISAGYLTVFYVSGGYRDQAILVALAAGAIAGFLVFNFNPARIFMGDSGSLFIGFLLGASSLLEVTHVAGVPAFVLAPIMVLAIPIFDTLFVSVTRRLRGQAVSQGGTDHSSHRLVRLGLRERRAVILLYALSAISGGVALLTRYTSSARTPGLIGFWFFFLMLFGVYLFQDDAPHNPQVPSVMTPWRRLLSRDTLVFFLDPVGMVLSYYLAYALRFGAQIPGGDKALLVRSLPIVVAVKLLSLWMCRAFRHSWWRGSVSDVYRVAWAMFVGEILSVLALTGLYRFDGYSRTVFFVDAFISWGLLLAIRRSFGLFRDTIYTWRKATDAPRRVFILGTSAHAELTLQFLRDQSIDCVGFIDTNGGADLRRYVFGRPVLGRVRDLPRLSKLHGIFEVVVPDQEEILLPDAELQSFYQHRELRLMKLGLYDHKEADQKADRSEISAADRSNRR